MILFENTKKPIKEDMTVTFDKLRRLGSLSGWQRILYNFIVNRLGDTYLLKIMNYINNKVFQSVPEDTNEEEIKNIIKLAFIDFVDSSM